MQIVNQEQKVIIDWSILKGVSTEIEDFSITDKLVIFLIGGDNVCDKIPVYGCQSVNTAFSSSVDASGKIHIEIDEGLPTGLYSLKAVWVKNARRVIPNYAEKRNIFSVTDVEDEATNPGAGALKLKLNSHVHSYGYDGLDAYEIAFMTGATELKRSQWVFNDEQVSQSELLRVAAENARVSAENARVSAESGRVSAESGRVSAESSRVNAENQRVQTENVRNTAEGGRVSSEYNRTQSERFREQSESQRVGAEMNRSSNEDGRVLAEAGRVSAESGRVSAENARVSAEEAREGAEAERASMFNTSQAERQSAFEGSESSRQSTFSTNEAARQATASADHTTATNDHTQAGTDHVQAVADHVQAVSDHGNAVLTTQGQGLSDTQKENARGNIGAAKDSDVTDLAQYLVKPLSISINGYYRHDGILVENDSNWVRTDYCDVCYGMVLACKVYQYKGVTSMLVFFDKDKNILSNVTSVQEDNGIVEFSYPVPKGAKYVIISTNRTSLNSGGYAEVKFDMFKTDNLIGDNLSSIESIQAALSPFEKISGGVNNGIVKSSGELYNTDNNEKYWCFTNRINVNYGDRILLQVYAHPAASSIAYFDAKNNYISGEIVSKVGKFNILSSVPLGADNAIITFAKDSNLNFAHSFVQEAYIIRKNDAYPTNCCDLWKYAKNATYINSSYGDVSDANWLSSEPLIFSEGVVVEYQLIGAGSVLKSIAFYDENMLPISSVSCDSGVLTCGSVTSPSNTKYIRICGSNKSSYADLSKQKVVVGCDISAMVEDVAQDKKVASVIINAIGKCTCIGDSVTIGQVSDYPRTTNSIDIRSGLSYPTRLGQMTGWTMEVLAKEGYTPTGIWNNYVKNHDFSASKLAIVELGYNGGLTDTLSTDVTPYTDYNDYADTYTGNYCKIIKYIKDSNANAVICLMISPNVDLTTASVIVKIANTFGCKIISLKCQSPFNLNDESLHGYKYNTTTKDYVHFNALGYVMKANFVLSKLQELCMKNGDDFNKLLY